MSIQDLEKLFQGNSELLAFVPPVGYLYLYIVSRDSVLLPEFFNSVIYLYIMTFSIISSSFIYNYSLGDPDNPHWAIKWSFYIGLAVHFVLLLHVNIEIAKILPEVEPVVYGAVILFVSIIHISLLVTHRIIRRYSQEYDRRI